MSTFTRFDTDACIKYSMRASIILDKDYYHTVEDFTYVIDDYPSTKLVRVPAGFLSDGASIPRAFWSFASPIGRHAQAAILHDYLCETLTILVDGTPEKITRKEADVIFKESLLVLGVSKTKAQIMYAAVSGYRIVKRVNTPTFSLLKRGLELEIASTLANR